MICSGAEPVETTLADDVADIWRDVKEAIEAVRRKFATADEWGWRADFESHWARHARDALVAVSAAIRD